MVMLHHDGLQPCRPRRVQMSGRVRLGLTPFTDIEQQPQVPDVAVPASRRATATDIYLGMEEAILAESGTNTTLRTCSGMVKDAPMCSGERLCSASALDGFDRRE